MADNTPISPKDYPIFTVDTVTRKITTPTAPYNPVLAAVEGDTKSNAILINIPKYLGGGKYLAAAAQGLVSDLRDNIPLPDQETQTTTQQPDIRIRCLNAKKEYSEWEPTIIAETDTTTTEEGTENGLLQLSWVLESPITDYAGVVTFSIVFKVIVLVAQDAQGNKYYPWSDNYPEIWDPAYTWSSLKEYQWQTLTASISIAKSLGMDSKEPTYSTTQDQFYYEVFSQIADLRSRIESGEGGGGGGTSDYSQLSNKPSINGVTLSGNQTSADLNLQPTISVSTIALNGNTYNSLEELLSAVANLLSNNTYLTT